MARKPLHTPEKVIGKLREAEVKLAKGTAIAQVCKDLAITENTYLPMATRVRRHEGRPGAAAQGAGEGEQPPEAAPGRRRADRGHPQGGRLGKTLCPAKLRELVEHVRQVLGPDRVSQRRV
jgi:hypothetical protein